MAEIQLQVGGNYILSNYTSVNITSSVNARFSNNTFQNFFISDTNPVRIFTSAGQEVEFDIVTKKYNLKQGGLSVIAEDNMSCSFENNNFIGDCGALAGATDEDKGKTLVIPLSNCSFTIDAINNMLYVTANGDKQQFNLGSFEKTLQIIKFFSIKSSAFTSNGNGNGGNQSGGGDSGNNQPSDDNTSINLKILVIATAGQSNMEGYDESPITADDVALMGDRIKQLGFKTNNKELIPLDVCAENFQDMSSFTNPASISGHTGTKGVHLPLANTMLQYIPNDYIIVILPCAYGGTGFSSGDVGTYDSVNMKPSAGVLKWSATSPYYQALRDRLKLVLDMNPNNKFGGLIWCQGEADGANPDANKTGFNAMMAQFATDMKGYENQSLFGAYDKSCIFIYETIAPYWYQSYANASGVRDIWKNYRSYIDKNFVEIPWTAHTNATNGTGATSSTKTAHFGDNAFKTWVAPRLANRILDNTPNGFYTKPTRTFTDFTLNDFYKPTDSDVTLSLVGKGLFTTANITGSIDDVRKTAVFFRDNAELVIFCMKRGYFGIFSGDKTTMATDDNPYTCIGIYDKTRNLDKMLIQLKTTTFTTQQKAVANTLTYASGDLVIMAKKDGKLAIYVYQVDTGNLIAVTGADDINGISYLSSADKARGYRFGVLYGFSTSEASYVSDNSLVLSNAKYIDTLPSGTNVRDNATITQYAKQYLAEF